MATKRNTNAEVEILLESSPLGFVLTDSESKFLYTNPSFRNLFGYTDDQLAQMAVYQLTHPDSVDISIAAIHKAYAGDGPQTIEKKYVRSDGTILDAVTRIAAVFDDAGAPLYQCTSIEDISERIKTEQSLASTRLRAESIIETAHDAIIELNADGRIEKCNNAAVELFGWSRDEMTSMNGADLISLRQNVKLLDWLTPASNRAVVSTRTEMQGVTKSGDHFPLEVSATSFPLDGCLHHSIFIRDIGERKRFEAQQRYLATHDQLTDLANRNLFVEILDRVISASARKPVQHALAFIDLDDFKKVNDSLGHQSGDKLLRNVAHRLTAAMRKGDCIARLGGDEFTVLIQEPRDADEVKFMAKKLIEIVSKPFRIDGVDVCISPSIGIAIYPQHGSGAEELLKNADIAMYKAKSIGRNTFKVFSEDLNSEMLRKLKMESCLRAAIENNEIEVHYQPQFSARSAEIKGLEALARWSPEEFGSVSPAEFVGLAEKSGLIQAFSHRILRKVCEETKPHFASGALRGRVAVNVSPIHFLDPDFVAQVNEILEAADFDPEHLEIEITESAILEDLQRANDVIHELQAMKIDVALDDFGAGYSSLSYLHSLSLNRLKIDKSFVDNLADSERSQNMMKFIIQLAHNFNLEVVAEGVEDSHQCRILVELDCDRCQGYYFSKPRKLDEIVNANENVISFIAASPS